MPVPAAHAETPEEYHRGFVLTGWKSDSYLGAGSDTAVRRLAGAGSDHAAIFTQWFMDGPTSSRLVPDAGRTPSDASMERAIEVARDAGMAVTIKPQIGIRTGSWIGGAYPADPLQFWDDYRTMLLHYADLAERTGAEMLVVGTEMRTLSWDEAHWRPLIAEVRTRFRGRLTYAANYDEYDRVPFWDALDFVGVDAYFALAEPHHPAPPVADLVAAWRSRGHLSRLAALSGRLGKKVIFTEIGYRGGRTTAVHPNVWDVVDETDTQAQANAYEAFYRAVAGQPWVAGYYWWEVNTDAWWVQDYSPLGKPAEQVMAAWNHLAQAPVPAPPAAPSREPAATPAPVAPASVALSLRGRRIRGLVTPYSLSCEGRVSLQLRRRGAGRWRRLRSPAPFAPAASGAFTHALPRGPLQVRAVFRSRCGRVSTRWAEGAR